MRQEGRRTALHRLAAGALAGALVLGLSAAPAGAAEPVRPAGSGEPVLPAGASEERIDGGGRLSNERTLTRWAHAYRRAKIRLRPRSSARSFARLRYRTEDDKPEVYLALRSARTDSGETWIKVRVPMRPNGRTGWVKRRALGTFHIVRTRLVVDRRRFVAKLYRNGRRIWRSRVGVGKPSTPTPRGRFWVRERLRGLGGIYGPWAFGTSAYSDQLTDWPGGGVVGIHGTNQPGLIPGRPSNGCVRVPNRNVRRLAKLLPVGTPVRIR